MGDLCEIIPAHGFLFGSERPVVGCHNIQRVTVGRIEGKRERERGRDRGRRGERKMVEKVPISVAEN